MKNKPYNTEKKGATLNFMTLGQEHDYAFILSLFT